MLRIYTDAVTKYNYDENGDKFSDGFPRMFFRATERVVWQICSSTPEDVAPDQWAKYTGYSSFNAIGAYLTADDNYTQKILGKLKTAVSAGSVTDVVATFNNPSFATIPASGIIGLFDENGSHESFQYDSRTISGTQVTFHFTSAVTVTGSYAANSDLDVGEAVYMQAALDTVKSDAANGTFVFDITAYSEKLRRTIVYSNVRQLNISGLELAIFTVDTEEETVTDLERYVVETFTIRSGVADTSADAQLPDAKANEVVTLVNTLVGSGLQFQFSADGTNWHDTQVVATDIYMRVRNAAVGGTWSNAMNIPKGADGEDCYMYIAYASDDEGSDFSLTASTSLKYISFLTSAIILNPPTLDDFIDAGCDFLKYIGDDGLTPTIDSTTKNWKIGTTDTGVCAQGVPPKMQYAQTNSNVSSDWHDSFVASYDKYVRFSVDNGETWTTGMKFIGDDAPTLMQQFSQTGYVQDWHSAATSSDIYTRFSVDGGETWSDALQVVPFGIKLQYSQDAATGFHSAYAVGDKYVRFSTDNGETWTTGMKFIGDDGLSYETGATGTYAERDSYDTQPKGFSYLVTSGENEGKIYFKQSNTSADWSAGRAFITPPAFAAQYSQDGLDWHDTATSADLYVRFSCDDSETWTTALQFKGTSQYLYVAFASDNQGTNFSLTAAQNLPYRAEFHSETFISSPTAQDFAAAGAVWAKYIGSNWLTGNATPLATQGNDGDFYLKTSTGDIYRKDNGTWSQVLNIIGPAGAGITLKGEYSSSTTYAENDGVTYQGSFHIARQATTGNPPPTLPDTQNTYWTTYVQKGDPGSGGGASVTYSGSVVSSIAAGENVSMSITSGGQLTISATGGGSGTAVYPKCSGSDVTSIVAGSNTTLTMSGGVMTIATEGGGSGGGSGLTPLTSVTELAGSSVTIGPGAAYTWTVNDDSTLNISGGETGKTGDSLITIELGSASVTAGTGLDFANTLAPNTIHQCAVRWNGTSATLYTLDNVDAQYLLSYVSSYVSAYDSSTVQPISASLADKMDNPVSSGASGQFLMRNASSQEWKGLSTLTIVQGGVSSTFNPGSADATVVIPGGGGGGVTAAQAKKIAMIFG